MKNSKAKGSSFERNVAKKLSLWLSNGEAEDWVWRTASSGGKGTQVASSAYYYGDLCPVHPQANWLFDRVSIECKNVSRSQLFLLNLFTKSRTPLRKFWQQARRDAKKSGRYPVLIFHLPNTRFEMVMTRWEHFQIIGDPIIPFIELPGDLFIVRLDMALRHIAPEFLKSFFEKVKF